MKVLIIEKDSHMAQLHRQIVMSVGEYSDCVICDDGTKAISYIETYHPEVLIMAQQVLKIKGLDIAKWACSVYNPFIIMVTSLYGNDELKNAEAYIDRLLPKPVDGRVLKSCLTNIKARDYHQPRCIEKFEIDSNIIMKMLAESVEIVENQIRLKDLRFLADAVEIYIKQEKPALYKDLALRHSMANKHSAYLRMSRIRKMVNSKLKNMKFIEHIATDIIKLCEND